MKKILILFLPLIFHAKACVEEYCYAKDKWPYYNFSHRTPYLATANQDKIEHPAGCEPHFLWAYIRHGTRFPSKLLALKMHTLEQTKGEILKAHEAGKGVLHWRDARNIAKWTYPVGLDTKGVYDELTLQGVADIKVVAGALKQSFPAVMRGVPRHKYIFQASDAQRTQDSAVHFVNSITRQDLALPSSLNITINDLIRLHKNCPNFQKEQMKESVRREMELFKLSSHVNETLVDVSQRIGFTNVMPYDVVETMYESCAFESAWQLEQKAPFCAVFSKEDLQLFEYKEDLELYWKYGYGNPLSEKLGCPLISDMMAKISDAAKPEPSHYASVYIGHVQMILPLMVNLGVSHDEEPLRYNNYEKMKEDRKWRLSYTANFAANIVVVLYSCPSNNDVEYQVVLYQNGREIVIPKCGKSPCPLEELKHHFQTVFDDSQCNSDFC